MLKRTRFAFLTADGEAVVTVTAADRIKMHRTLKDDSLDLSGITVVEYRLRLAYAAARRAGIVAEEVCFDAWTETVEAFDDLEDDGPGEAEATPAS